MDGTAKMTFYDFIINDPINKNKGRIPSNTGLALFKEKFSVLPIVDYVIWSLPAEKAFLFSS